MRHARRTALAHDSLPVVQALADELIGRRLAAQRADLQRGRYLAARAAQVPPRAWTRDAGSVLGPSKSDEGQGAAEQ